MSHCIDQIVTIGNPESGADGMVTIPIVFLASGQTAAFARGGSEEDARGRVAYLCATNGWIVTKNERPSMTWAEYLSVPESYRGVKDGTPYWLYMDDTGATVYGPVDIPDLPADWGEKLAGITQDPKEGGE